MSTRFKYDYRNHPTVPKEAFTRYRWHQNGARIRGIEWQFTPETWWAWWQIDNRWERRGRGADKLCMARKGDEGPYSWDNVYCTTNAQNHRDIRPEYRGRPRPGFERRPNPKRQPPTGVRANYDRRSNHPTVSDDEWKAFQSQKQTARLRGIEWLLTAEEWCDFWRTDNRWERRGKTRGCLVMGRKGDVGPYSVENIYCTTVEDNAAAVRKERKRAGLAKARAEGRIGGDSWGTKAVITPEGRFPSAKAAAQHFGISHTGASRRAANGWKGWRYDDNPAVAGQSGDVLSMFRPRAVITPKGRFRSARAAAIAYGIDYSVASRRAAKRKNRWRYEDEPLPPAKAVAPRKTTKPVVTPEGRFDSAELAAAHHGITVKVAHHRARLERHGWRYEYNRRGRRRAPRAVITPKGRFPSAELAAQRLQYPVDVVRKRAKTRWNGWRYEDDTTGQQDFLEAAE